MTSTRKSNNSNSGSHSQIGNLDAAITIAPDKLHFGVVSTGFIYRLKFTIQNNLLIPIRVRAITSDISNNMNLPDANFEADPYLVRDNNSIRLVEFPDKIAPGMFITLFLELTAESVTTSSFLMTITQDYNSLVFTKSVEANVVSVDTFKHIKKALQLQKRPVYSYGVTVVSVALDFENISALQSQTTGNATLLLMDTDDIDDMLDYPLADNMYWDPFDKCMRIDPELCKVYVHESLVSVEKSIKKTLYKRKKRLEALEEQGFFTQNSMREIAKGNFRGMQLANYHSTEDSLDDLSNHEGSHLSSIAKDEGEFDEDDNEFNDEVKYEKPTEVTTNSIAGDSSTRGSHAASHQSLLATQRVKQDRIERERHISQLAAIEFAKESAKDSSVNCDRTLTMILNRKKYNAPMGAKVT